MAAVMKIEYTKGHRTSKKYILECEAQTSKDDLVVFDITQYLRDEDEADQEYGYASETGPRFGFAIHNALKAGQLHASVMEAWRRAPDENYRPKIGYSGTWKIYKVAGTDVIKKWSWVA